MISLDDKNGLFYTFENVTIDVSKLYENREFYEDNIQIYPELKYELEDPSFILNFEYKGNKFSLFMNGIKYNLFDKDINGVLYSFTHLQKILEKYNYKNPVYCQKSQYEFQPLVEPEKIKDFNFLDEIIIKEKIDDEVYKKIYDSMTAIYNKTNINIFKKNIKLKLLSVNLNKYFFNNDKDMNLDNELPIFKSPLRLEIFSKVKNLLNSKDKIFAICGPYGIGKSFTSLLLQKYLYLGKINSIYVNLSNNEEISKLKETLIKESFFLNLGQTDFVFLANKITYYKVNNIWDIISLIDDYCREKQIKFLLILDQYKRKCDPNENLLKLKVDNIFLLSSINDKDVKGNLVSQIKCNKELDFKYVYYISLGINNYIEKNSYNIDIDITKCFQDFNYLPNTKFLLEYVYNHNILDFYNNQYTLALKKLSKFYKTYNISYLSYIFTSKKINDSKVINPQFISEEEFLSNINDIPLKYISFHPEANNNYYALYYAFDYVKYPIENLVNNYIAIQRFNTKAEASLKGGEFENIIKHKFILDRSLFKTDSFISVNKIIDMDFSEEYKNIKSDHLKEKSCVFISQSNFYGEEYDFGILYPKEKEIILIQAKYKLTSNNTKKKSEFTSMENISNITNSISQKIGIIIEKIYLLYISSVEYNYQRKNEIHNILKSKQINCIFYSINEDYFTSDFENNLQIFLPTESMEIYPKSNIYIEQIFSKKRRTDELLYSIMKSEQKSNYNNEFILKEYNKFIDFLNKSNINKELKKHLGNFESPFLNNYRLIPNINFVNYLLFFKKGIDNGIDFSKNIYLTYEYNNSLVYYNIKTDKKLKNFSIKDNAAYKDYYYIIGKWKENNSISLEE